MTIRLWRIGFTVPWPDSDKSDAWRLRSGPTSGSLLKWTLGRPLIRSEPALGSQARLWLRSSCGGRTPVREAGFRRRRRHADDAGFRPTASKLWQWRWRDHDLRYRTSVPWTLQPGASHGPRDGRLTTDVGRVALRNSPQNVNIIVLCMQSDFYAPLLRMNLQEIVNWKMILHSQKFKLSKYVPEKLVLILKNTFLILYFDSYFTSISIKCI